MSATISQPISKLVSSMNESATLRMAQLARELKGKGVEVISLTLGEPDFDTPDHIKEAAKQALDDGYTKYTPVPGLADLREAIVRKFKRDNGLDFKINQIVVSNGAKQTIANLCLSLLDEGDEVILFAPYWVSYYEIVKMAGGVPVPVVAGVEQDFKVTADQIREAITDRTKMAIFSSPCNPSGSVYSREELEDIAEAFSPHDNLFIVSDEIYEYINFTGKHASIGTVESIKDRVITVNGFAKGFAMTGWRLGYMGAPQFIADACSKLQGQFTSGANAFSQKAAAFALDANMAPSYKMRDEFLKRRNLVISLLKEIPGFKVNMPEGAFYVFPDISYYFGKTDGNRTIHNSVDFCEYLLEVGHVGSVDGEAFGIPECMRISYAASEKDLRTAIKWIGEAVAKLK